MPDALLLCMSVCIVAETEEIQELLSDHGIAVQTMTQVSPIRIMPARILSHVYVRLGTQALLSSPVLLCLCLCTSVRIMVSCVKSNILCYWRRKLQEIEFKWEAVPTHRSSGNVQILPD